MPIITNGNSISDSAQIVDGIIVAADIATDAVDTAEIKSGAVKTDEIGDGEIMNADINASAAIADTKLAQITTAGKVSGAAITSLASLPAGAGIIPAANLPGGSDVVCIPRPVVPTDGVSSRALNNPVDGYIGLFNFVRGITLNKLTFYVTAVGASGTFKVGIFSADGQTRYATATSGTISGTGEATITFAGEVLPSGNLLILAVSVGGASITLSRWAVMATVTELKDLTSEPTLCGVYTCTSGTVPATITIASISASEEGCFVWRLDN